MLDSMLGSWIRIVETGFAAMDSTMRAARSVVGIFAGEDPITGATDPPTKGPVNIDEAAAEFTNRMAFIATTVARQPSSLADSWRIALEAAIKGIGSIEPDGFRQWLALPLQLPLSFGSLLSRLSLTGIYAGYVVGLEGLPDLAAFAAEVWTDAEIFTSLQYNEYVTQMIEQVQRNPDDARGHLLLGRTYMKLGRYAEAGGELAEAAKDPNISAKAHCESLIANYYQGNFPQAVQYGVSSLALEPSNDRARFWLWLAAQKLGGYPPEVPEEARTEIKAGRAPTTLQFEDVSQKIGLDKTGAGRGTAIFDMDGDGYLDVVIASNHAGCSVYHNNGDGTFTDVSVGSGLEYCYDTFAITVGDYNNDGWDDLYITRQGFFPGETVLFRNNGDGTFTDVTKEAGVQNWGTSFTAQWVDYDCDGNLDLFVTGNQGRFVEPQSANRLFHNNGDGTFTDVTQQAGIVATSPTIGCAWGDYDNDGRPDLFLSSGLGRAQLYRNNGDGTFTDVSRKAGIDQINLGFIALWCDYDNDGWLDLIQFVWSPEDDMLHTLFHGERPAKGHPLNVYHNNRDGTFTLVSEELGLDECWGTMCGNAGDFNNDGHIDLLLGNGAPPMDRTEPPIIYEFGADGRFHNVTFSAGLPFTGKGHGANMADFEGDGRLSLIVSDGGMYPADLLTTGVYRPKTLPGNFLNVRLVGTTSNRNAIGARLKLDAGGRSQYRLVNGGTGFGCMPYEQHFGLGKLEQTESLEIFWPNGLTQRIENPPVNTSIKIVEGQSGWEEVYKKRPKLSRNSAAEPRTVVSASNREAGGNGDGRAQGPEIPPVKKNRDRSVRKSVS